MASDQLTELMNWVVQAYSAEQAPADFSPFTVVEVTAFRHDPEADPETTRRRILATIAADLPELADVLVNKGE